jgi:hypothetical protein
MGNDALLVGPPRRCCPSDATPHLPRRTPSRPQTPRAFAQNPSPTGVGPVAGHLRRGARDAGVLVVHGGHVGREVAEPALDLSGEQPRRREAGVAGGDPDAQRGGPDRALPGQVERGRTALGRPNTNALHTRPVGPRAGHPEMEHDLHSCVVAHRLELVVDRNRAASPAVPRRPIRPSHRRDGVDVHRPRATIAGRGRVNRRFRVHRGHLREREVLNAGWQQLERHSLQRHLHCHRKDPCDQRRGLCVPLRREGRHVGDPHGGERRSTTWQPEQLRLRPRRLFVG